MKEQKSGLTVQDKEFYMMEALKEAKLAKDLGEVPIGAVVVCDGKIIGRGHNQRELTNDATTHAEMTAIQMACKNVSNWRLLDCQLFVTLEPCPMCSGAILLSRIDELYYGAKDPKGGTCGTLMNLLDDDRFNHMAYVENGICEEQCQMILKDFFKELRKKKKMKKKTSQLS